MGLFTGTQGFGIVCSVVKMKLVALWLHSTGMGLFGIFNSTLETASVITDLGLRQSAVRNVAQSVSDSSRLALVAGVVRRWCALSGFLGASVLCAISPLLSEWFMGTSSRWWQFALLAFCLLLNGLVNGEVTILQGTRRLRYIARTSMLSSFIGLLLSIPLYRYLGDNSVILSILAYSLCSLVAVFRYRYRSESCDHISRRILWKEGKMFIRLGIYMSIAGFITNLLNLLFISYLQQVSSISEVGLYQSGSMIIIRYAGLIFTSVGMEFYPRLAMAVRSRKRSELFVSHEIILLQLVIVPMILCFFLVRDWVVIFLYSSEFLPAVSFVMFAMISLIPKTLGWSMAYQVIVSGSGRTYLVMEVLDGSLGFLMLAISYHIGGLPAVGVAFILWYTSYSLITGYIYHRKFCMCLRRNVVSLTLLSFVVCGVGLWFAMRDFVVISWVYTAVVCTLYLRWLIRLWRR